MARDTPETATAPYTVDVIVPIHGIGPVLVDTVLSVFDQCDARLDIRCVVVVDGCPLAATNAGLLTDLEASGAYPLEVIHQKNAGVVAARNAAVDHILKRDQLSDFTLFLDGDDLLGPGYIVASIRAIETAQPPAGKTIGWAYADQFHFGDVTHWVQYPTRMWGARFAQNNFSQPSSLIRTTLLEQGLRFDPQFNLGIEDWDFWCGAVRAGYVGVPVDDAYVFYRRLIGSRSSFNRSNDGITRFRMAQKHGLDSYDFVTNGDAMFPRYGALQVTEADSALADRLAFPQAVRFGRPDRAQADTDGIYRDVFGRLAVQTRYRSGGVLDGPYTPQLIVMGAQGDTSLLDHSHLFALEHLFALDPDLTLLELRQGTEGALLVMASNRLFQRDGKFKLAPKIGVLQATGTPGHSGPLVWLHRVRATAAAADVLSPPSATLWARFCACAPRWLSRAQSGFPRNIVGTQLSVISDFYKASLGYLPLRHLPGEEPDQLRTAFVVPATGRGVDQAVLADLITRSTASGARPYLVRLHDRALGGLPPVARPDGIDPAHVIDLFDVLPDAPHMRDQIYHGTGLFTSRPAFIAYLTGALSYFSEVVNFGQRPVTNALASLKVSRRTKNTYVSNPWNVRANEIEHLCAYLSTYGTIVPVSPDWADEALGLGVPRVSLAAATSLA